MRIVAVIQARVGSERLPGKVLEDIGGQSALARVVERVRMADRPDEVIVATSEDAANDVIAEHCAALDCKVFRGSEDDVLNRMILAGEAHGADAIVRITADCPLIDPGVIDESIALFLEESVDYAANIVVGRRTYPRGLDVEVVSLDALRKTAALTPEPRYLTHVTLYIREHTDVFAIASLEQEEDLGHWRWTLDEPADLDFIRAIYGEFDNRVDFRWRDVCALIERKSELAEINEGVAQKTHHEI